MESKRRRIKDHRAGWIGAIAILGLLLALSLVSGTTLASNNAVTREYLIGTGLLCGLGIPNACPDVSLASNGDTITIAGRGHFNPADKDADGGGTFVHKNHARVVLGTGIWEGGVAVLRVHLEAQNGNVEFDATLQVNCLIGHPTISGIEEGVRLAIDGGPNFNTEFGGITLFILEFEE